MKTLKIPYTTSDQDSLVVKKYRKQQSNIIRYAYNRLTENKSEKEIRLFCKNLNNIDLLNSWLIQSGIKKAEEIYKRNKNSDSKVIFGGKQNLINRINNKISKEEYKNNRLLPLNSVGESLMKGNRVFKFNIIEDNSIVFKPNRNTKIKLQLPKLRKNYKNELFQLQQLAEQKAITISVQIDDKFIYLSFEEKLLEYNNKPFKIKNRIASIDMNPNYIGFVIKDHNSDMILHKEIISLKSLNDKFNSIKANSSDPRKIKLNNTRRNLILEISKRMVNTAIHYQCEVFAIEKLDMGSKNHGLGKRFNKLINNQWLRTILVSNLEKRCNINKIKFKEVYPQYSSFIGCMLYPTEVDSIAAAMEINRRGYTLNNYKSNSGSVMYPKFDINLLKGLWKNQLGDLDFGKDWKQFYTKVKESKVRYRLLLDDVIDKVDAVFKVFNIKDYIGIYNFI